MLPTTRRRLLPWIPIGAVLVVVLALLLRPQPVPVDVGAASRGPLAVSISEEGEARVHDVFVVSAPSAGLLWRVALRAGDEVKANSTVVAQLQASVPAFLDARTAAESRAARDAAVAGQALAEAQLRRVEAEAEFAAAELRRLRELAARESLSRNALDAAETRARTATAAVAEARANLGVRQSELQRAQAHLLAPSRRAAVTRGGRSCSDCIQVRSPVSGRVLRVVQESETVLAPGAPILEVGDLDGLEVEVELLSEDAVRVRSGQRVLVEGWGGDQPLEGRVRVVEPFGFTKVSALGVEEQRVRVLIDFTGPEAERRGLGHGYRVQARIVTWESADVLRVPLAALFREGDGWAVFVADGSRARLRPVQVGHQNLTDVEILGGLAAGERIVLHPNDRIEDGTRIVARADGEDR